MKIIEYSADQAKEIADVFHASVHAIDPVIYSEEQKSAWAPTPIDYAAWEKRLEQTKPYVLLVNNEIAGFIELESDGHIDCAYVLPRFQCKGVASKLLTHIMEFAKKSGLDSLYVEASIVAKPFFEKHGFFTEAVKQVNRRNTALIHYSMRLTI